MFNCRILIDAYPFYCASIGYGKVIIENDRRSRAILFNKNKALQLFHTLKEKAKKEKAVS